MRKNILIVSPVPIYPPNEGNKTRILRFIKNLKIMGYEVHFLCSSEDLTKLEIEGTIKECDHAYFLKNRGRILGSKKLARYYNFLINIVKWLRFKKKGYYEIDDFFKNNVAKLLNKLNRRIEFDCVLVEYVFLSKAFDFFSDNVVKILDTHDVFAGRGELFKKFGQNHTWFHTDQENEAVGLNRADKIVAIQEQERSYFEKISKKQVVTIGHNVEIKKVILKKGMKEPYSILFVGSANQVNQVSVRFFLKEVFPFLQDKYNDRIKFILVGAICSKINTKMKNVEKAGIVDNLEDIYCGVDIVINPVQFGTGLKIKNIEALGYGKVLITSSVGAEGLNDGANSAFLVADSGVDFISKTVEILENDSKRICIEREALKYAIEYNKVQDVAFGSLFL